MKNIVGTIVEKENFFGRKKEIKRAWGLLDDGCSLILAELEWKLPYHIQLMLKEIGDLVDNGTVSKKIIDLAIKMPHQQSQFVLTLG